MMVSPGVDSCTDGSAIGTVFLNFLKINATACVNTVYMEPSQVVNPLAPWPGR